ncbi:MAG: class I SAM-dependent methyltransferase [Patescibacteria group bacterium]|jgi:ubiquinone/menaquinone biosynthesis C-methylase UbiE
MSCNVEAKPKIRFTEVCSSADIDNPFGIKYIDDQRRLSPEQRRANQRFYDRNAEEYAKYRAWTPKTEQAIKDGLLRHVEKYLKKGDRVLVIGTGTGRDQDLLQKIEGKSLTCFGLDLSKEMLLQAGQRFDDHVIQANATQGLPFINESFDFIYCEAAAEHMDEDDLYVLLPEFKRVLKKNVEREGQILFNVRMGTGEILAAEDKDMMGYSNDLGEDVFTKYYVTYDPGQLEEIFRKNHLTRVEQWTGRGGTPNVQAVLPWLTSILKVNNYESSVENI